MGLSPERETDQPLPSPVLRLERGQLPHRRALVLGRPGWAPGSGSWGEAREGQGGTGTEGGRPFYLVGAQTRLGGQWQQARFLPGGFLRGGLARGGFSEGEDAALFSRGLVTRGQSPV